VDLAVEALPELGGTGWWGRQALGEVRKGGKEGPWRMIQ
jgi:hypothetical protein